MKLDFKYREGTTNVYLSDTINKFIPGQTVAEQPCLQQAWGRLYRTTLDSVSSPIDMEPSANLTRPDSTIVFVIYEIVEDCCQPTSCRKIAIHACLFEPFGKNVRNENILSAIYTVDTRKPSIARGIVIRICSTFDETLEDANKEPDDVYVHVNRWSYRRLKFVQLSPILLIVCAVTL